ncbi:MAG: hypothetical protein WCO84_06695 [bacterium]
MIEETKQHLPESNRVVPFEERRRIENNPLLDALKQVIESNAEYARGVSTLLDADLEREILLTDIKKELQTIKKTIIHHDQDIERFDSQVLIIIDKLEAINTSMSSQLIEKLAPLYLAANLQIDGKQYNPTDKLVINFQKILSSKLSLMIAGIVIWVVVRILIKSMGMGLS